MHKSITDFNLVLRLRPISTIMVLHETPHAGFHIYKPFLTANQVKKTEELQFYV